LTCEKERFSEVKETLWKYFNDSGVMGLIPRITLAVVIFPHGAQKALGGLAATALREP
jgi:hypothetical protein